MAKRREFLKTTAALGGIAIVGAAASRAEAQERPATTTARPSKPGTISISFDRNVKIDHIHEALKQVIGRLGCPGCGLLGYDVRLGIGGPESWQINVQGVREVTFRSLG